MNEKTAKYDFIINDKLLNTGNRTKRTERKSKKALDRQIALTRKRTEAHEDLLLKEADEQLKTLTAEQAELAFSAEIQRRLDGIDPEPSTLKEALSSANANEWLHAVREELRSLHQNRTWDVVQNCNKKGIGSKWVF